jgi:hypothetical protein
MTTLSYHINDRRGSFHIHATDDAAARQMATDYGLDGPLFKHSGYTENYQGQTVNHILDVREVIL